MTKLGFEFRDPHCGAHSLNTHFHSGKTAEKEKPSMFLHLSRGCDLLFTKNIYSIRHHIIQLTIHSLIYPYKNGGIGIITSQMRNLRLREIISKVTQLTHDGHRMTLKTASCFFHEFRCPMKEALNKGIDETEVGLVG